MNDIRVPADIPSQFQFPFLENIKRITNGTGRLMLFAGDQKVEHLNDDYYGKEISQDDASPEHMFQIASRGKIGAFATQLGLITEYGTDYRAIPYIIKLNAKTKLSKEAEADPVSTQWYSVHDVINFKKTSGLDIVGVGYTVYIGSAKENTMLNEAAQMVKDAHANGLIATVWAYPRGSSVENELDPHLIAGAAGVGASLGADYVKVNYPHAEGIDSKLALKEAVAAAGRTRLICAGGASTDPQQFLSLLYDQIHISGAMGNATGRNVHQKPLDEAVRFCNAIYAITVENKTVQEAMNIYNGI